MYKKNSEFTARFVEGKIVQDKKKNKATYLFELLQSQISFSICIMINFNKLNWYVMS